MAGAGVAVTAPDGGEFQAYLSVPGAGHGPGIVLLQEIFGVNDHLRGVADLYAAEGYAVLAPDLFWRQEPGIELGFGEEDIRRGRALLARLDIDAAVADIGAAAAALRARPECRGMVGALGFCLGGRLAVLAAARTGVDCAVGYYPVGLEELLDEAPRIACPISLHLGAADPFTPPETVAGIRAALAGRDDAEVFVYPDAGHAFANPARDGHDRAAAGLAHSRSVALFRRVMGPVYNLAGLWEKHCEHEFGTRDVDATMATMVAEPYVNHVPTMTGGVGYRDLYRFYRDHFIPKTPADTRLVPLSRTVGSDRVVDEMLFCFTHDIEIDWMLPGVPPTGRYVEIPLVAIVCFRGDRLCHEHIYWDQASVLVQIGALDPAGLPVAGIETARKVRDESLPSNALIARGAVASPPAA